MGRLAIWPSTRLEQLEKLVKKIEMGAPKIGTLVKKIQMNDPKVGKVGKSIRPGQAESTYAMLAGGGEEDIFVKCFDDIIGKELP